MANILDQLVIKLRLEIDEFRRRRRETEQETDTFSKRLQEQFKKIGKEIDLITKGFGQIKSVAFEAAGVIAGVALTAVGLTNAFAKNQIALSMMALETGESAKSLKAWGIAAEKNGISAENMASAIKKAASDAEKIKAGLKIETDLDTGNLYRWADSRNLLTPQAKENLKKGGIARLTEWKRIYLAMQKEQGAFITAQEFKTAGMGDILGVLSSAKFDTDLSKAQQKLEKVDFKGQADAAMRWQSALIDVKSSWEILSNEILAKAVAPELEAVAKEMENLSKGDRKKLIDDIRELVHAAAELAKFLLRSGEYFDIFFKKVKDVTGVTIGFKEVIEGIIGLKALSWFVSLSSGGFMILRGAAGLLAGSLGLLARTFAGILTTVGSLTIALPALWGGFEFGKKIQEWFPGIQTGLANLIDKVTGINQGEISEPTPGTTPPTSGAFAKKGWSKQAGNVPELIEQAAKAKGLDPAFMKTMAMIESGGNPKAYNPSSASGVYQFITSTGKKYGLNKGNKFDPVANIDAGMRFTLDNIAALKKRGIDPTPANLYLAHQQGAAGLAELLNATKGGAVSAGLRANMNANAGKGRTAKQFYDYWTNSVNQLYYKNKGMSPISDIGSGKYRVNQAANNPLVPIAPTSAEYGDTTHNKNVTVMIEQHNNISANDPKGVTQELQQYTGTLQNTLAQYAASGYQS